MVRALNFEWQGLSAWPGGAKGCKRWEDDSMCICRVEDMHVIFAVQYALHCPDVLTSFIALLHAQRMYRELRVGVMCFRLAAALSLVK
jgi:hypothetical protein